MSGEIPEQFAAALVGCEADTRQPSEGGDVMVLGNILVAACVTALLAFISALAGAHSSNAAMILFFEANGTVGASVSGFDIQTPDVVVVNPEDVLVGDVFLGEFTSTSPNSAGGPLLAFILDPRTLDISDVAHLTFDVSGGVGELDAEFESFQTPLHEPGIPGVVETGGILDLTTAFIAGNPVALPEALTIEVQLPLEVPNPRGFRVALAVAALGIAVFRLSL